MRHIKKYRIFETEIKRSFGEWLKNPKAPRKGEFTYQFEFPVKKVFNIDEDKMDLDNLADYLKQEKGCDIYQDIANEIDLRVGLEEDEEIPSVTKDEVRANINEYFYTWIEQQYNNDMSRFFRMYDLDFEDSYLSEEDFEDLKEDFNSQELEKNYTFKEYNHDFKIFSIMITTLQDNNRVVGEIKTNRELTQDEIDAVKDYLEGQCSDGWGEKYEQSQEKEKISGLSFYVSIKPWWNDGYPEWYLEVNEI